MSLTSLFLFFPPYLPQVLVIVSSRIYRLVFISTATHSLGYHSFPSQTPTGPSHALVGCPFILNIAIKVMLLKLHF